MRAKNSNTLIIGSLVLGCLVSTSSIAAALAKYFTTGEDGDSDSDRGWGAGAETGGLGAGAETGGLLSYVPTTETPVTTTPIFLTGGELTNIETVVTRYA